MGQKGHKADLRVLPEHEYKTTIISVKCNILHGTLLNNRLKNSANTLVESKLCNKNLLEDEPCPYDLQWYMISTNYD